MKITIKETVSRHQTDTHPIESLSPLEIWKKVQAISKSEYVSNFDIYMIEKWLHLNQLADTDTYLNHVRTLRYDGETKEPNTTIQGKIIYEPN